jgi:type IV pilus assembly protein PilA
MAKPLECRKMRKCSGYFLLKKNGFTLLELLVVVVVLSVLASVAIPSFLGQIGKARESEIKGIMGGIARAQQAYHFEKQTFATSIELLSDGRGGASFGSNYADFPDPDEATDTMVKHISLALNPDIDRVRNYSVGVYFNGGFSQMFCESVDVGGEALAGDTPNGDCSEGTRIE